MCSFDANTCVATDTLCDNDAVLVVVVVVVIVVALVVVVEVLVALVVVVLVVVYKTQPFFPVCFKQDTNKTKYTTTIVHPWLLTLALWNVFSVSLRTNVSKAKV